MYINNDLIHAYRRISYKCNDQNQVLDAMICATKHTIKTFKCRSRCWLLSILRREGVGTNEVEHGVGNVARQLGRTARQRMITRIMRGKVGDAYNDLRRAEYENRMNWKRQKEIIPREVRNEYMNCWRQFMKQYGDWLRWKRETKVKWLISKWRKEDIVPDEVRGIKLGDAELEDEFNSEPRMYGGVNVNDQMKEVLTLPPNYGIYGKVTKVDTMISTEEALNKLRWRKAFEQEEDRSNGTEAGFIFPRNDQRVVDITGLRPSMLPYNNKAQMAPAMKQVEEVKVQHFKNEVAKVADEFEQKKGVAASNMNRNQKAGLKMIQEKLKDEEMVCFVTDKSGRWACDSLENYKKACEEQLRDGKIEEVSKEQHSKNEKEINAHALALGRILGLKDGDEGKPLRNVMTAEGTKTAQFYGLRKDHKEIEEGMEEIGPKVRPVCGAKEGQSKRISYVLCMMLSELLKDQNSDTQCDSTEELLATIEEVNKGDVSDKWLVGSTDIVSLYPSLDVKKCAKVIRNELYASKLVFRNLQWKEIALYLVYNMGVEELREYGLEEYCPTRRHNRRPPTFEASGSSQDRSERHDPWIFPRRKPHNDIVRKMFCMAIEVMIVRTMTLHEFEFDGKLFRQIRGGAIGLDLTGIVADVYMNHWDREVLGALTRERFLIIIYKRYKDDVNFIIGEESEIEGEEDGTRRRRIAEKIKEIAESVDENLKVTVDADFKHEDKKTPVLDIKVWIGRTREGVIKVLHTHYIKDVSTRALINAKSAHGELMKVNVMVNEITRILRNCSVHLEWEEVASWIQYFVKRLQFSGYDKKFRHQVVTKALNKYDKRLEEYRQTGIMFRKITEEEKRRKRAMKNEWYTKNGKYESVMFVEATPGGALRKKIEKLVKRFDMKIKVVEKVGTTIKRRIQRSNPFKKRSCERGDCEVCGRGSMADCRTSGCVYQIRCRTCDRRYRGTTSRTVYQRTKEEVADWLKKDEESPLWKHAELYHGGNDFEIDIDIMKKCFGKPSRRRISEAVLINELPNEKTMNNKAEWSYIKLSKVGLT